MDTDDQTIEPARQTKSGRSRNPFFTMVLCAATVFVLTILTMVAVIFSDPRAPIVRFMDAHAGRLIGAEVVVIFVVGLLALVVDRHQNSRRAKTSPPELQVPQSTLKKSDDGS